MCDHSVTLRFDSHSPDVWCHFYDRELRWFDWGHAYPTRENTVFDHTINKQERKRYFFFINDQSKNKIPTKENNSLMNQYFHCNTFYRWMLSMCIFSMINVIDLNSSSAFSSFDSALSGFSALSRPIQSINQSINQSIDRSINQSINGTNEWSTNDWSANQLTE